MRLAVAATCLSLAAGPVLAQSDSAGLPPSLTRDGRVTMAELAAHSGTVFRRLDADGDGLVSRAEFLAFPLPASVPLDGPARADLFDHLDEDGDGRIHGGEWEVATDRAANLRDLDGDGVVTLRELAEMNRQGRLGEAIPAGMFLDGLADSLF